jgi:adenylate cyclase
VKHTGDGFLAAFESALDAADCALAVQRGMAERANGSDGPPLQLRIGLNLADVIIEPHDIFGDGVNLAARLQATAEPGGIVVSAAVAEQLRQRDGVTLGDLGEITPKNMRAVRAYALRGPDMKPTLLATPREVLWRNQPGIAVLPFRVPPADQQGAWFAEGIIEGIIHVLAGVPELMVISLGAVRAYAGREVDPRRVAEELKISYVLSGSVRRDGSRLRIRTELCDATDGHVIRSDQQDSALTDLFEMQDTIALQTVRVIAPAVRENELAKAMRKHPDSLTAYDLMLRALDQMYRLDPDTYDKTRGLLTQAVAVDPAWAAPRSHAANWHMFRIGQGWTRDGTSDLQEAARHAAAALERDSADAVALSIHGQMLSFVHKSYDQALEHLDRAIEVRPSCDMAWTLGAATLGWTGDGVRAVQRAERALQIAPTGPFAFFTMHMLSQGHYVAGNYPEAIAWARKAAAQNNQLTSNLRTLAAALVANGDLLAGREVAKRVLDIEPGFRLGTFAARTPFVPAVLGPHLARLRKAGLPQ